MAQSWASPCLPPQLTVSVSASLAGMSEHEARQNVAKALHAAGRGLALALCRHRAFARSLYLDPYPYSGRGHRPFVLA